MSQPATDPAKATPTKNTETLNARADRLGRWLTASLVGPERSRSRSAPKSCRWVCRRCTRADSNPGVVISLRPEREFLVLGMDIFESADLRV